MLSISSGDEEVSKDRGGAKGRASGAGGRGGRGEDDRGWDGEEPDCWKRVDEAELARRVREMRETRTAPVAQKYERKPSAIGRRVLNNLQSFPRGMECIDPLGLGIIDNRSLRLITESSESSPKSDKEFLDNSLREKLLYLSEKFDEKLFLSRIHQDTSSADLEAGALALKTDLRGRNLQRKQLVKDNFDCFVSCKTTIDDIESKLKRIEEDPEGSGTSHLFNCMQGVSSLANRAFEPLFERQSQAEKIRSVQGMLQRFRTLFNLPSTIRGSISKGEYDLALENTVRLLMELEPESDPVWYYLNVQNRRIRGLLEKCTLDHEARMENLLMEMRERALSDARWRQIQQNINQSSAVNYSRSLDDNSLQVDSQPIELTGEEVDTLRGKYIRRLTAVLIHHIPTFWKIALSVFSGKFAKSSQVSAESNVNTSANKTEEKVGDGRYSTHSLDEVAGMIRSTVSAYEVKVHNTFRDLEESNILQSYMSDAINEISKACQAFEAKESAPPIAVMALRTLQAEITKITYLGFALGCEQQQKRYQKRKHGFLEKEDGSDIQDLVMSFSGLEEKVLQQYTFAKANMIRTAAMNYLLNSGVQWGAAPAVKGVRDAAVELLHTLVAVHSEVFAGAKPLLDKTLGILVEGLIDTFLSLFYENKSKDLMSLDANAFCQLMLELEYFETILNPYFTPDARESLKSLQGVLLEKATENVAEAVENPGHQRRSTRGSEDALDDRQQGMTASPDDLIALAQQCSSELLQAELERTRINTACFIESIPLDSVPEPAKAAYGFRGSMDSPSKNYRGTQAMGSPSFSRQRRR
ncbi:hypothetical protein GH714_025351 [Hevea brasiliensis]|uniref:Exocyst complex component SEC5 n=1 Tax=Hevea brasiliensis TaxID=3981 RepID=A0A6A6L816_HEVBR|nr:hypothetical protein GH714_025351 [Hevea brasiliensis]